MALSLREILRNSKGSTAILVLGGMLIFSILGAGLMTISKTSQGTAADYRDGVATEYIAEAGVQDLLAQIKAGAQDAKINDALSKTGQAVDNVATISSLQKFSPQPNQTGSYVVTLSKDKDGVFHIKSEATLRSDTTKKTISKAINLTLNLTPNSGNDSSGFYDIVGKYIVYAKQTLSITNNDNTFSGDTVHDIGSDGTYSISATTRMVNGTAWANSLANCPTPNPYYNTANIASKWDVKAPTVANLLFTPREIPAISNTTLAKFPAFSGQTLHDSDTTLSGGTYYYNGNFSRWDQPLTCSGPVTIYINGNLSLGDNSHILGHNITIYVTGSTSIASGSIVGVSDANAITSSDFVKIYSQGQFSLGDGYWPGPPKIQSQSVYLQSQSSLQLNNVCSISTPDTGSITLDSINNSINLTNQASLNSGTVILNGYSGINLNSNTTITTPNTGVITLTSANGNIQFTNTTSFKSGTISASAKNGLDLNSNTSLTTPSDIGIITLSSPSGPIQLTNNSTLLAGAKVLIQAAGTVSLNSNANINYNSNYKNAITLIYSNTSAQNTFSNNYHIGGLAALVVTQGSIDLPGTIDQRNTVFFAKTGASASNSTLGPVYTNGPLSITPNNHFYYSSTVINAIRNLLGEPASGFSAAIIKTELVR